MGREVITTQLGTKKTARSTPVYGGQAIIEGVMFKSPSALSLAVRLPNGKIYAESKKYISVNRRLHLHNIPLLRGITVFIEMMYIGISYLNKSATLAVGDDDEHKKPKDESNSSSFFMTTLLVLSFLFSTVLALAAFKLLPQFLSSLIWSSSSVGYVVTEGIIKLGVFILYLHVIGKMKDVARVFQYHGAEHKVIRAFEAGKKLTVKNVKIASRYHPRCGTSFVVFVIILSVIIYGLIPFVPAWAHLIFWQLFALRIALLPLLAGISYEVLALTAKIDEKSFWSFMLKPGYFVQSLTTREPDAKQMAVAIAAFKACESKTK